MNFKVRCDSINDQTGDVEFSGRSDEANDIVIVVSVLHGRAEDQWKAGAIYAVTISE